MKYLYWMVLTGLALFALPACAQTKNGIVKTNSYYMIRTPGTIPVDDNGQEIPVQRDTTFSVYAETVSRDFVWERAWRNGREFTISAAPVQGGEVEVGVTLSGDRKVVLKPGRENTLWRLELTALAETTVPSKPLKRGEVLLQGKRKDQPFFYKTGPSIELASPVYP